MLKQGEIYKFSKDYTYWICGGIIPRDTDIMGVRCFTVENINSIGFEYLMFMVDEPSMKGINSTNSDIFLNLEEKYFLDTNINAGKKFSVFMLKWKMLSQIKVCTVDEFLKDITARGKKYCSKLMQARVGDRFRCFGDEYTYLGIDNNIERNKDIDCHIALLDKANEVQYVFSIHFLFEFEKIGHIDIPEDARFISLEEYKKITGLTWLI